MSSRALATRTGIGVRSERNTKLNAVIATAPTRPSKRTGSEWKIIAASAEITSTMSAAIAARVVTSMRCFTMPRSAGSKVTEASIMTRTPIAAPVARPRTNDKPMTYKPRSEIMTVTPAKRTALPLVSTASTTASSTDIPACKPSRYRVTMNNA